MLLDTNIRRVAGKELSLFFASPVAYLFLATFAAITLFIFFWGEAFFSRNIADIRPLFEWMPVLLVFLTSALTMRMWSEERRTGTLEHVLTQPVAIWRFVLGKFVACLVLLAIALLITLPLPITVANLGDLDWGPVWSGYLATLLLGAAYISVGLFVSARSDNQIVSLISSVALCGLLYLVGATAITNFVGQQAGEWLRLLGTGARFDAITRGMIDLRDFYYYLSLIVVFLALNTFALERERWAATGDRRHHNSWRIITVLLITNALAANLWLGQITALRVDTTQGKLYSISEATENYLSQLQEPLLIRGYFSAKTHPLLAPLVPQMRDLMREYEVAGKGRVRIEFIDPMEEPELEQEANQKYGIHAVPFQVADRYQSALVNSYFDVLIQYGDEFQSLGFRDLIEIKAQSESNLDVQLRNPEYDMTRAIKNVLLAYQSGGNLFDTVISNLQFTGYISATDRLPETLASFRGVVEEKLQDLAKTSRGRLQSRLIDPEAEGGRVAEQIASDYGFKPMATNLFDRNQFYFYMTLSQDDQIVQIPLGDMTADNFEQGLKAAIKRFAGGFTKTVALVVPEVNDAMARFGQGGLQFNSLREILQTDRNVRSDALKDGRIDSEADILWLVAPKALDKKQLFAVDQFLMRGGTVIVASSPYSANLSDRSLNMQSYDSGIEPWLNHHGLSITKKLVLDPQNAAFPVPVTRQMGGFSFQEMRMLDYPFFADIRTDGLSRDNAITRDLQQVTFAWGSPITVDSSQQGQRQITELLHSSEAAWLSDSLDVMPKLTSTGTSAFTPQGETGRQLLGVISQGRFESYFKGQESPLLETVIADEEAEVSDTETLDVISSVIEHSPESARIILFGSNDFLRDRIMQLSGAANGSNYLGGLQLAANTVDWALEEQGLLSIRSRGHFNRTLDPLEEGQQVFWESLNYILAVIALGIVAAVQQYRRRKRHRRYRETFAV
jgi:ABC-2 type transport system permease protein